MKVMAIDFGFRAVRDVLDDRVFTPRMADQPEVNLSRLIGINLEHRGNCLCRRSYGVFDG